MVILIKTNICIIVLTLTYNIKNNKKIFNAENSIYYLNNILSRIFIKEIKMIKWLKNN